MIVCIAALVGLSGAVRAGSVSWRAVGIVVLVLGMAGQPEPHCRSEWLRYSSFRYMMNEARRRSRCASSTTRCRCDRPPRVGPVFGSTSWRSESGRSARRARTCWATSDWARMVLGQRARILVRVRPPPEHTMLVASLTAVGTPTLVGEPPAHQRVAAHIRDRLRTLSARALSSPESGLLPGLVLGDISGLDNEVRDDFRDAGLSHLTAVSGSNFAIVCGAALVLLALLGCPRRLLPILGLLVIVAFVILVRPSPSVPGPR